MATAIKAGLAHLLVSGGDERITPHPATGLNKYGLPATPEPNIPAYGSSTASTISAAGFAATGKLQSSLGELSPATYARELNRIRAALQHYASVTDGEIIFADSGTTLHLLAAQLIAKHTAAPLSVILMEPAETGSGVPASLRGRYFNAQTPRGDTVVSGAVIAAEIPAIGVLLRDADGNPRPISEIDAEVEARAAEIMAAGGRVLLNAVDVSKTGLIAPSPACAIALKKRFGGRIEILLDACQFRLAPATLRFYLEQDFIVALTGSKFMGGPIFSGALLMPPTAAQKFKTTPLPPVLGHYSTKAEWPYGWTAQNNLPDAANFGLLLRWEAALAGMQAFQELPPAAMTDFFTSFAAAIQKKLTADPAFEPLPVPALNRQPFVAKNSWDDIQTIFPFLLRRADGRYLSKGETKEIYQRTKNFRIGQPVDGGQQQGIPVSALRLCAGAAVAVDALSPQGRGAPAVIAEALAVLDDLARLVSALENSVQ